MYHLTFFLFFAGKHYEGIGTIGHATDTGFWGKGIYLSPNAGSLYFHFPTSLLFLSVPFVVSTSSSILTNETQL